MSDLGWVLLAVVFLVVVRYAWLDVSAADRREAEDEALRKYGPMD